MTQEIILPPMSRRSLELFFLMVSNASDPSKDIEGTVVGFRDFVLVSPNLRKKTVLRTALSYIKPVLAIYGFFLVSVSNEGYRCCKSRYHKPDRFDNKFFGAKKTDEVK